MIGDVDDVSQPKKVGRVASPCEMNVPGSVGTGGNSYASGKRIVRLRET
jgi:hypothetical protein